MSEILDVWIGLLGLYLLFGTKLQATGPLALLVAYALTRAVPVIVTGAPLYEFFQSYRWLFYLMILALAVGKRWAPLKPLVVMTWTLMALAIGKGVATITLVGPTVRPGLLLENNFEIALFSGLVAVAYPHLGKHRYLIVLTLGVLTVVAGSRSGVLAFVVLATYAVSQNRTLNPLFKYVSFAAIPAAGLVALNLFARRAANETQIDRSTFLDVFMADVAAWSPVQWLLGTTPVTPLSSNACFELRAYDRLFSSLGDGSCYSVILHSFLMRVVFDAGVVGLVLCFGMLWILMVRAGVPISLAAALMGIAITNSLSVSGPNNPYVFLPVLLAVLTVSNRAENRGADQAARSARQSKRWAGNPARPGRR